MKSHRFCVTLVSALLLPLGCQPAVGPLSEADLIAIDDLVAEYRATAVAGDWDAWSALWTVDAVYMVPSAPALEGRAAIRASLDAFPTPPSGLDVTVGAVEGIGSLAWARGSYAMTMPAYEESPEFREVGKFLWVLKKQPDGTWLIDSECYNSDSPPPPQPEGT